MQLQFVMLGFCLCDVLEEFGILQISSEQQSVVEPASGIVPHRFTFNQKQNSCVFRNNVKHEYMTSSSWASNTEGAALHTP